MLPARTRMPPASSSRRRRALHRAFGLVPAHGAARAPWQVEPKVRAMEVSVPTSTQLEVPMEPGTSTGWPMSG